MPYPTIARRCPAAGLAWLLLAAAGGANARFVEIASAHGVYRLELRALQAGARYRLAVTELHPATERDSKRLAAQNAFKNGEQLSAKSTKDSLKKAIASFDEALALWQAAGEETGIGSTGLEAVAISPDGSMFGYGRTDATVVLAANPFTALLQPDDR